MLSRELEQTLHRALALANKRRDEYATLEHLLLALIEDEDAIAVFRACDLDRDCLRRDLVEYIDSSLSNLVGSATSEAKPTAGFQRVLQRAAIQGQSAGREQVTGTDLLVALFAERDSHAVFFLQQQDMSYLDAVNYMVQGITKVRSRSEPRRASGADDDAVEFLQQRAMSRSGSADFIYCDAVWTFTS